MAYGTYKHGKTKASVAYQRRHQLRRMGVKLYVGRAGSEYAAKACIRGASVTNKRGAERCGESVVARGPTAAVRKALVSLARKLK